MGAAIWRRLLASSSALHFSLFCSHSLANLLFCKYCSPHALKGCTPLRGKTPGRTGHVTEQKLVMMSVICLTRHMSIQNLGHVDSEDACTSLDTRQGCAPFQVREWLTRRFSRWSAGSILFLASWAALMGPAAYASHLMSGPRLPFTAVYFGAIIMTVYFAAGVSFPPCRSQSPNSDLRIAAAFDDLDDPFRWCTARGVSMVSDQLLSPGLIWSSVRGQSRWRQAHCLDE